MSKRIFKKIISIRKENSIRENERNIFVSLNKFLEKVDEIQEGKEDLRVTSFNRMWH